MPDPTPTLAARLRNLRLKIRDEYADEVLGRAADALERIAEGGWGAPFLDGNDTLVQVCGYCGNGVKLANEPETTPAHWGCPINCPRSIARGE